MYVGTESIQTNHFTILEPQKLSINDFLVLQKRRCGTENLDFFSRDPNERKSNPTSLFTVLASRNQSASVSELVHQSLDLEALKLWSIRLEAGITIIVY